MLILEAYYKYRKEMNMRSELREGQCEMCGGTFKTFMPTAIYCGDHCRQKASRERRKMKQHLLKMKRINNGREPGYKTI